MAKASKSMGRSAKRPSRLFISFSRQTLWIAVAVLGVVILAFIGWLTFRAVTGREDRQEAAALTTQLMQETTTSIDQVIVARQEIEQASKMENLDLIKVQAQRFYNVLVGARDGGYVAAVGNPASDDQGVLNHLRSILASLDDARLRQATLGTPMENKRKLISEAVMNAQADLLGAQLHAKAVIKAQSLEAAQQDIQKCLGWLDSAISATANSDDPQTQTLYFAQARLYELSQALK